MRAASCPDPAQLQELVNETLDEEEEARLIAHLDSCASCREKLETLAGEEFHVVEPDVERSGSAPKEEPAFASMVAQLQEESVEGAALRAAESVEAQIQSFLAPPAQPGHLGRLGGYEVLAVVGRGGMGIVFKARDETLDRIVAIKVMVPQLAASATARQRFLREARAAAAIRDEHVINIHAVAEENGLPYMVMEYINGVTLQDRLKQKGPFGLREILRIGLQTAKGLAAAHAQGRVHRDIKPANILLENGVERVKLSDFGLARAVDDASLTQSGVVAGTPEYMAPEQARGEAVDTRTDLFSLGSVLYALCAGRPPFRAHGSLAVLKRVCEDTPRPLRDINPDLPEWLCGLIAKLHAKNPADRFSSAGEVADLLGRGLSGSPPSISCPAPARKGRLRWKYAIVPVLLLATVLGVTEAAGVTNLRGMLLRLFSSDSSPVVPTGKNVEPLTEAEQWERSVAKMPAEKQVEEVARRLRELNPDFDGKVTPAIVNGVVTEVKFLTDEVQDISPLRVLKELQSLHCDGTYPRKGILSDLKPLRGLPLKALLIDNTQVADLSPLRGMPLIILICGETRVADLSPLQGMKLETLTLQTTKVTDLTPLQGMPLTSLDLFSAHGISDLKPLQGMPLRYLNLSGLPVSDLSLLANMKSLQELYLDSMPVTDLTPLRGLSLSGLSIRGIRATDLTPIQKLPLKGLRLDYQPEREAFVRSFPGLEFINDKPAAEFWKEVSGK
jgi:serine/threonine protein kinase